MNEEVKLLKVKLIKKDEVKEVSKPKNLKVQEVERYSLTKNEMHRYSK